jgi:hypothetical protein
MALRRARYSRGARLHAGSLWRYRPGMPAFAPVVAVDDRAQGQRLPAQRPLLLMIEVETGEAKLRIPADTPREAILAVMEGLGALKRRR